MVETVGVSGPQGTGREWAGVPKRGAGQRVGEQREVRAWEGVEGGKGLSGVGAQGAGWGREGSGNRGRGSEVGGSGTQQTQR